MSTTLESMLSRLPSQMASQVASRLPRPPASYMTGATDFPLWKLTVILAQTRGTQPCGLHDREAHLLHEGEGGRSRDAVQAAYQATYLI